MVDPNDTRLILELDRGGGPIAGRIAVELGGEALQFSGFLGLIAAIGSSGARLPARDARATTAGAERRTSSPTSSSIIA